MHAPQPLKSGVLSWFRRIRQGRTHDGPARAGRRWPRLLIERLEDRLTPTTLTDHGGALTVLLDNPGDTFSIKAVGTNLYALTSVNGASVSDLFAAGLTGASLTSGQLSLISDSSVTITDLATGGNVAFLDSTTNSYAVPITVSLGQPLSGGINFSGASSFAQGLTVTTTHGDIDGNGSISVTGDLSLIANANINLTGSVTVSGATTLAADGTITASAAGNSFAGGVSVTGVTGQAGSASIASAGALVLNEFQVSGSLTVSAGGSITQGISPSGTNTVGGAASFTTTSGNLIVGTSGNTFGGAISASVQGTGNVQIDNTAAATTLRTILLGTGNLTVNADDGSGTATIKEDSAGGITTGALSTGTASFNVVNDTSATIDLSAAANDFAAGVTIAVNGGTSGTSGSFLLQNVDASASATQIHFGPVAPFTVNNLSLNFPEASNAINTDSITLPGGLTFSGNLSLSADESITDGVNPLSVGGNASFTSTAGSVTISNTADAFNGDLSASVTGSNNVVLSNAGVATTIGTITLGSGSLTINDDESLLGTSTVTEDKNGHGITTAASPSGTAPQFVVNIVNDTLASVLLNTAANDIGAGYAVQIKGQTLTTPTGTTGDFGYRSTAAGANPGQITLTNFTVSNLTLEFDSGTTNVVLANVLTALPATANVSVTVGGNITIGSVVMLNGTLTLAAGGTIANDAALTIGSTLTETAGGSITQTSAGTITGSADGIFTVTGTTSSIDLTLASPNNSFTGPVSFNTPPADTGNVAFTASGNVLLTTSKLGTGTFTVSAGGTITEQAGATITQGASAGQATFNAGAGATTIDLSAGTQNFFTGVVSFNGGAVTSVALEDANPLATLASIALGGVPNLANLTLRFDGTAASLVLPPSKTLPYSLDLIEENNIVLPATATLTVPSAGNKLTLESIAGSINLFGTVSANGAVTLTADGFGGTANILAVNPANLFGSLSINNAASGTNTILSASTLTLGNSIISAGPAGGSLTVTALAGLILQAPSTTLKIGVPMTFNAPGTVNAPGGDIDLGAANNLLSGSISANVTNPASTNADNHAITITNSAVTTTLGTIVLATGTLTVTDTFGGTGSTVTEAGGLAGITSAGPVIITIGTDTAANVNLAAAPNLLQGASLKVNGAAAVGTTGDFGLRNIAPTANLGSVTLNGFTIHSLTLEYDFASINYGSGTIAPLAPSASGNIMLIAGGGITQAAAIVTSGSAVFGISGSIGDASIVLNGGPGNTPNKIATGGGATIALSDPLADNKQMVALTNQGDINLAASTFGLSVVTITSLTGNIASTASLTQQPGGAALSFSAGGNAIALTAGQFSPGNSFYGPVTFTGTGNGGLTVIGFDNNNPLAVLPTIKQPAINPPTMLTSVSYDLPNAPIALGSINTASLTVTAGGNIVQQSGKALTVSGEASFGAGTFGIQLTNQGNNITEVSLSNSGANAVALTTTGPVALDVLALGCGPLTINAGGAVTETAGAGLTQKLGTNDVIAGTVTFNAPGNPVLLDNSANQILGPLAATASVLTVNNNGSLILGNDTVAGGLTVVSQGGTITQAAGSSFQVGGSAFLSSGPGGSITLTNPGNTIGGPVSISSAGNAALNVNGPVELSASTVGGTLTIAALSPGSATPVANVTQAVGTAIDAMGASFTSANGNITLANSANNFNDQPVSLSAPAPAGAIQLTDSNVDGVQLGAVSFGTGGLTLTASGPVNQASGAITGSGAVQISASGIAPTSAIPVSLAQAGNNFGGTAKLGNVTSVTITNLGSIFLSDLFGSPGIASSADVALAAGGTVTLPAPGSGTLTLGALAVSANTIQLGTNLTTASGGVQLTGTVVIQQDITLDTSAAGVNGNILVNGNVTNSPSHAVKVHLPSSGQLEYGGGTWMQGSNNLTITGASASFIVDPGATFAMTGGTLALTGMPVTGVSPSTQNAITIDGTLQVGGNVTVSDGGSDSIVTLNLPGTLAVALGSPNGSLMLTGLNASDQINLGPTAQLTGFGGAASGGPSILSIAGGGSISGTFANAPAGQSLFMGADVVNVGYTSTTVAIQPLLTGPNTVVGAEPDGDLYTISVSGGTGLVVLPVTTGSTPGLDIVVRFATGTTMLTVTTTPNGGDGFTSVAGIALDGGGTAIINAAKTNVTGNISVAGPLMALTLNNWTGGTLTAGPSSGLTAVTTAITGNVFTGDSITLKTPLTTLTANAVTGISGAFGPGTITAASFGTIAIGKPTAPGSFFANLVNTNTAANPALRSATITGTLGGNWDLAGPVGTVTAGATSSWNLGRPNGPGVVNSGLVTNVTSLTLGTATDVGIDATGTIGLLKAISLNNTVSNATLQAGAFGSISTTGTPRVDNGNFLANVTATGSAPITGALGSLTVAGNLGNGTQAFTLLFANGKVGTITVGAAVQNVAIDAVTTSAGGTITSLTAGEWTNANLTAASIGTMRVTGNVPALLLGDLSNSTITLTGIAGSATPALGTFSTTGQVTAATFNVRAGSITTFTVGGQMVNTTIDLQSATTGSLTTITADDWQFDTVTAKAIGTLKSIGRLAAPASATSGLLGNITDSTITTFGGGIGTFQATGNVQVDTGTGYLLANGTIITFSVGRSVSNFQVSTDLNGGPGGIGSLTAGRWSNSDLTTFALGSATITGFATPEQLPAFTPGDLIGSDIIVNGSFTSGLVTSGIGRLTVGHNLDNDFLNVPFGAATLTVTGTVGVTSPSTIDLLNPLAPAAGNLGSLTAGAMQSLTLYANQAGSISTTGGAFGAAIAVGFAGSTTNATGVGTLAIGGGLTGSSINVKEGITRFTVGQAGVSNVSIAAAYDLATATIGTLSAGSWNGTVMAAGSIGTFTVGGIVTSSRITLMSAVSGVALGTFTAAGRVLQSDVQVTSGNVTSFTSAYFVNSGLFVGYRLVDPFNFNDTAANGATGIWEGTFTLGTFKTTAVLNTAAPGVTAGFQTSNVVAGKLGTITLTGVNPTPSFPATLIVNGQPIAVPPPLVAHAAFGVGFRANASTGTTKVTIAGSTVLPSTGAPTRSPAFFYIGING